MRVTDFLGVFDTGYPFEIVIADPGAVDDIGDCPRYWSDDIPDGLLQREIDSVNIGNQGLLIWVV